MMMRLQKYLALSGVASRRSAEKMIADGRVTVDGEVITEMGVQVADHNGRVRAILSLPVGGVQSLAFSGNMLYVVCGNRLFVRPMKSEGHCPAAGKMTYKSQGQG